MRAGSATACARRAEGFILIEVLVALALLGLLLVPLADAAQCAARRAEVARGRDVAAALPSDPEADAAAWHWGSTVRQTSWGVGPTLDVVLGAVPEGGSVGLWVDGWLVGEWPAGQSEGISVGRQTWVDRAGAELVIRARAPGGAWGPPWRSVVPDALGRALCDEGRLHPAETLAAPCDAEVVAVHHPALCSTSVQATGSSPQSASPEGGPLLLTTFQEGSCPVCSGDREQVIRLESGRGLDVFF